MQRPMASFFQKDYNCSLCVHGPLFFGFLHEDDGGDGAAGIMPLAPPGDARGAIVCFDDPVVADGMHIIVGDVDDGDGAANGGAIDDGDEGAAAGVEAVLPDSILGCHVYFESHMLGRHGGYRRAKVFCMDPRHGPSCAKRRNVNLVHDLGEREVESFLACWLSRTATFPTQALHQAYKPSLVQQQQYLGM